MSIFELVQEKIDQDFVEMVAGLMDLFLLSEKIVAANDGWE